MIQRGCLLHDYIAKLYNEYTNYLSEDYNKEGKFHIFIFTVPFDLLETANERSFRFFFY